jgi:hypothetical protein
MLPPFIAKILVLRSREAAALGENRKRLMNSRYQGHFALARQDGI